MTQQLGLWQVPQSGKGLNDGETKDLAVLRPRSALMHLGTGTL